MLDKSGFTQAQSLQEFIPARDTCLKHVFVSNSTSHFLQFHNEQVLSYTPTMGMRTDVQMVWDTWIDLNVAEQITFDMWTLTLLQ